ncbi:MAG: N-acetylmuramic acid 6-phosphate etherase [Planctomycetes bacterium GWF2_42_9]|nr:MAG: N-acetylmuramic acid 6-phosphate etherase [Planctomycetes bacterium GWF2_42_9]HAL45577.1 N-acetylmuramic acid 6-phosphate etherase [Phycisphaerales bacterium]
MKRILPTTEKRNKKSANIDKLSTLEIVKLINSEDMLIAGAVGKEAKKIAAAVEMIVERFKKGGRLFYVGAGTSGRLGVLDASECPPTYGVNPLLVQGIIAGGKRALVRAVEGAEDKINDGITAIAKKKIKTNDVVVGIAACGLTPFVRAALKEAKIRKAGTIFVTCAPEVANGNDAEILINPVVGPEVITGSTRMKAGTATKLVLNLLTTTTMIKMGKVYGNLMVDLKATNNKLKDRSVRIVAEITGLPKSKANALLKKADGKVKIAIVMYFRKCDLQKAIEILDSCGQSLRKAIENK